MNIWIYACVYVCNSIYNNVASVLKSSLKARKPEKEMQKKSKYLHMVKYSVSNMYCIYEYNKYICTYIYTYEHSEFISESGVNLNLSTLQFNFTYDGL